METAQNLVRKETPMHSGRSLLELFAPTIKPSGGMVISDMETLTLRTTSGAFGTSSLTPLSQLGTPIDFRSDRREFLTRISVLHAPRKTAGMPNLWESGYTAPDGVSKFSYLRSGTPVPAAVIGLEKLDPTRTIPKELGTIADRKLGRENIEILVKTARTYLPLMPNGDRLLSIDLQSYNGVPAEVEIVKAQKEASEAAGILYINIPVQTQMYGNPEAWPLPKESIDEIRKLITAAASRVVEYGNGSGYWHAITALLDETTKLVNGEENGTSTPPLRYALAARVGTIASSAYFNLHANCRSGKDRTALFDTELKFVQYQLWRRAQGLAVSGPGEPVLEEEKSAWRGLLLRSGNSLIQLINAGAAGNKVRPDKIRARLGEENIAEYVGDGDKGDD